MPRFSRLAPLALSLFMLTPFAANATAPVFSSITATNFDSIVKELSADMSYTSVTPASSLGSVWGLEIGAVAGITNAPEIQGLVKVASPTTDFKAYLPHGGILARLGVPLGITGELMFIPKKTVAGVSLKETGGALEWTLTDVLLTDLPFSLAVKGFYTKTSLDYTQSITFSGSNTTGNAGIDFTDKLYGSQVLISKKFLVFEPYVGLGYVHADGTLSVNAAGTTFFNNTSFTDAAGKSATSSPTSMEMMAGLDIRLLFLSVGAEYDRVYGKNSYTARLSFRF